MFGNKMKLKYEAVKTDGDVEFTTPKRKFLTTNCIFSSLFTTLLIGAYYIPSICLTFYQRWLYQSFHFPLVTVLVHMIVKYLLATLIRLILIRKQGKQRILLGWTDYIIKIAPTGIFSGIDISFSNWGLELIQVSLYTMTKSTTIVFILFFSILFKLEKKSWSLCGIVVMITIGLILFTYKATQFNLLGFLLLLLASVSSGLRWTCVQLLLQKSKMGMRNPIDMIYHMQPWMIVSVLPFAVWLEGPTVITNCQLFRFTDYSIFSYTLFKILIGAVVAFVMEVTEVMVVTYTSSLTLSIAGIVKEVVVLGLAVKVTGDQMSFINLIGLLICLLGIVGHVIHKILTNPNNKSNGGGSGRGYESESENHELGKFLIDGQNLPYESDNESEKSDTQILFDILNRHDR